MREFEMGFCGANLRLLIVHLADTLVSTHQKWGIEGVDPPEFTDDNSVWYVRLRYDSAGYHKFLDRFAKG